MRFRRTFVLLVASAAVAVSPSMAVAQSAGDDQYVDPLNGVTGGGSSGSSENGSSSSSGASGSGSGASGSPAANGSQLPGELARTGAELPLIAGAGLLLLAGGLGIRRISGARP